MIKSIDAIVVSAVVLTVIFGIMSAWLAWGCVLERRDERQREREKETIDA